MKGRRRHTPEQIARRLAEGDEMLNQGATVAEVDRALDAVVMEAYVSRGEHPQGR